MIQIIERSLVVPSSQTPDHSIWLSSLDLLVARSHTPTVYFYRSNNKQGFFSVESLKNALGKVLVQFYPLAGRFGVDQNGRAEIKCSGKGVLFLVARSDLKVDDFGDFEPSDEMRRMLVPNVKDDDDFPLVVFQLTFFKCGGVCLGSGISHTAVDGLAALHFVNTWSDIARGITSASSIPPYLDRTILKARSTPNILFDHPEYTPKVALSTNTATKTPLVTAHLKLSQDQIAKLRSSDPEKPISTFKAVVAHVWKSACKARSLKPDQDTRLTIIADARARMQPPLPAGFLGNATFHTSAVATAGKILSNTLEYGANKITEAIKKLDTNYIRSLIDDLEPLNNANELEKRWRVIQKSDLCVISWLGLPMYDADFGWGKPIFMGRACLSPVSGLVYLMQDPRTEGGLTLALAFEPQTLHEFKTVLYENL